jgi:hypothetical protein
VLRRHFVASFYRLPYRRLNKPQPFANHCASKIQFGDRPKTQQAPCTDPLWPFIRLENISDRHIEKFSHPAQPVDKIPSVLIVGENFDLCG